MSLPKPPDRYRAVLLRGWHVFGLFGFALAQPLFDLLARYPQFLVAHGLGPEELILLTVFVSFGVPAVLLALEFPPAVFGEKFGRAVHHVILGLLLCLFLLQILNRFAAWSPPAVSLAAAAVAATTVVTAYAARAKVRVFFTWLSGAALLFPVFFLAFSPAAQLLFPATAVEGTVVPEVRSPATVVMVVFDEFPTLSLLDSEGGIDAVRFPNFARLARDSYWFSNATTVSEGTLISLPAILDGLYPTPERPRLPILSDHPRNLFTLLRRSHRLHVVENLTRLAPEEAGEGTASPPRSQLLGDLAVLSGHLVLPASWSGWLPPVTESWKNFGEFAETGSPAPPAADESEDPPSWDAFEADWSRRDEKFRDFVRRVQNTGSPTLHFFHSMLPHASWRFLPDGRRYSLDERPGVRGVVGRNDQGLDVNQWRDDPWLTLRAQQRHLLQVGFVDSLLGELIDRLRETGLYRDCLLVITADHGAGFQPGDSRRLITPTNFPEILWVPLFVKLPGQSEGARLDHNVQTIDILPTVAEALQVEPVWPWDGQSALSSRSRAKTKVAFSDRGRRFQFEPGDDFRRMLRKRLETLGWGDWDRLFEIGEPANLRGVAIQDLEIVDGPPKLQIQIDGQAFLKRVDPRSRFIPALIRGRVQGGEGVDPASPVALALNGRIEALSRTSPVLADGEFTALLKPSLFLPGQNRVEAFLVDSRESGVRLIRGRSSVTSFRLEGGKGAERLIASDGRELPVQGDRVVGWVVGGLGETGERAFVGGWAADSLTRTPALSVVVLSGQESLAVGQPRLPREDAAKRVGPDARDSGFVLEFPAAALAPNAAEAPIRVFGISSAGVATELRYPPPYSGNWSFRHPSGGPPAPLAAYDWGTVVELGGNGNQVRLLSGWGTPEGAHIWTVGSKAQFSMSLPPADSPLLLALVLKAYLPGTNVRQTVGLRVGDRSIGQWILSQDRFEKKTVKIPRDLVEKGGPTAFTLELPDAISPAQAGTSPDQRKLGVAIISLTLTPEGN